MATTNPKTRRKTVLRYATEPATKPVDVPPPVRRRWSVSVLTSLLLIGGAVWIAPLIVAKTPLLNSLLKSSLKDLHGSVQITDASLGWFSPVRLDGVVLSDASGKTVARVESVMSEQTLLSLLTHLKAPGKFRLERPRVEVVVRDGGSNLEDVLSEYLKPKDSGPQTGLDVAIETADGVVVLRDETNGGQWQIDHLTSRVTVPSQSTWPLEVQVTGVLDDSGKPGPINVALSLQEVAGTDGKLVSTGRAAVQVDRLPLGMCQALVRRVAPGAQLSGTLQTRLDGEWGVDQVGQPLYRLQGQTDVSSLTVAGPWLAGDQLRIQQLSLPCQVTCEGDKLVIERLQATSEVGQVVCQGSVNGLKLLLAGADTKQLIEAIKHANGQLSGQLDLARIAQLLPRTLRVRDDTKITSGQVNFSLGSRDDGARVGWQGELETSRLVAVHQGVELSWEQPLKISTTAHEEGRHLIVDRLECISDFLQIQASGSTQQLRAAAVCDLNRLTDELSRFVQLDGIRLAGQGQANVSMQVDTASKFEATANVQITRFELGTANMPAWTEDQLSIAATTSGAWASGGPSSVLAGEATVDAGNDRLQVVLTGPVDTLSADARWPIDVQLRGATAAWLRRLSPWVSLGDALQLDGQAQVSVRGVYSAAGIEVETSQINIQPVQAKIFGLALAEESLKLVATGRWLTPQQRLEVREATLETPPAAVVIQDATVLLASGQTGASGKIVIDGDLAKIQRWWQDPNVIPSWSLAGKLEGGGQLAHNAGVTKLDLTTTVQDLVATPRSGRQIIEPVVKLAVGGSYTAQDTTLSIERCDVASDAVELQAVGKIERLATTRDLNLTGRVTYDLSKVTRLLLPYPGNQIQLSGRETRSFQLAGPLVVPAQAPAQNNTLALAQQLTGKAEFGWQWANIFGFRTGATKLDAELGRGIFRLLPTEITVGQGGKLRLAPEGRLGPGPVEIVHVPARVMEMIEITPEMCQQWIGYVAPLLAGVAEARGRFSLDLDALRIPVDDVAKGDAAGRLTIHDVEIGPGPLIQEIAVLLGGGSAAKIARESVVPFRLAQGRVYHQNLELAFPDVTIRTQGSVGLDQTLALLVEMPIPPRWLGTNPALTAFKDQVIRLPIAGTLQRPQIDRRAVDQLLADMTRAAAESAVRREVNRGLDSLLEKIPGLK